MESANNRVRVFVRVRPAAATDDAASSQAVELLVSSRVVRIRGAAVGSTIGDDGGTEEVQPLGNSASGVPCISSSAVAAELREYTFDSVFPSTATQQEVFAEVGQPVLEECLNGVNGTILAYGQTGSGKTHSLLYRGSRAGEGGGDAGLLPRLILGLFDHVACDSSASYEIEVAVLQVYNEQVDDLLHQDHRSGSGHGLAVQDGGVVPGLTWIRCRRPEQALGAFTRASGNLVYAETNMNKASSRSHAVFQVRLTRQHLVAADAVATRARLCVVDLAGSERVKKSGVEGLHFKEATAINRSLLALGNVVNALAAKKPHVPLRDSKLTRVLDGSIGGNCRTALLICASPATRHAPETISSFEFATRAMCVEVNAKVNRYVVDGEHRSMPSGRRSRPQSAQRASSRELVAADSGCEKFRLQQMVGEAEQSLRHWKERVASLETTLGLVEEEAAQLHQALARAERSAMEWRTAAEARAEDAARAWTEVRNESARAKRAEERAIAAVTNLETVRQDAAELVARAEERIQTLQADLEAVWQELSSRAAADREQAAVERQEISDSLHAAVAESDGLRRQCYRAQQCSATLEIQAAVREELLQCREEALEEQQAALRQLGEDNMAQRDELLKKLSGALEVGERVVEAAQLREAGAADAARAVLHLEFAEQSENMAALEAQAVGAAESWAAERQRLEEESVVHLNRQRTDFDVNMSFLQHDLDSRTADLKRERNYFRRRLEEQRSELSQAETRWKQAREDALQEESERSAAQLKRVNAALKASGAREEQLRETNARLVRRLGERESREEDLQKIVRQQASIDELKWELEVRSKEVLRLCDGKSPNVRGITQTLALPPLPTKRKNGESPQVLSARQNVTPDRQEATHRPDVISEQQQQQPQTQPTGTEGRGPEGPPRRSLSARSLYGPTGHSSKSRGLRVRSQSARTIPTAGAAGTTKNKKTTCVGTAGSSSVVGDG